MASLDLRDAWADLLRRRPAFQPALDVYGRLIEAMSRWVPGEETPPSPWVPEDCVARWERGVPLLAEAPLALPRAGAEELLAPVLEILAALGPETATAVQRFSELWDRGEAGPEDLLPAPGRLGSASLERAAQLSPALLGLLSYASLRPFLEVCMAPARAWLPEGLWRQGVCPYCGAPPGFGDVLEDGRRRLACHLCGGGWIFSRVQCPFCGNDRAREMGRLLPEGSDEGYAIETCQSCRGYLKGLDRRVRWNGGPALIEDWGSPHLDLAARRAGHWRPLPTLIDVEPAPGLLR
jgi:FdhE protein